VQLRAVVAWRKKLHVMERGNTLELYALASPVRVFLEHVDGKVKFCVSRR
jgi:hypothetical protein